MRESAYKKAILKSQFKKDTVLHEIALHLGLFVKVQKDVEFENDGQIAKHK